MKSMEFLALSSKDTRNCKRPISNLNSLWGLTTQDFHPRLCFAAHFLTSMNYLENHEMSSRITPDYPEARDSFKKSNKFASIPPKSRAAIAESENADSSSEPWGRNRDVEAPGFFSFWWLNPFDRLPAATFMRPLRLICINYWRITRSMDHTDVIHHIL